MRAISIERLSRTVIDATTSSRASFSFTRLRRMSRSSSAMGSSRDYRPLLLAERLGLKMTPSGSSRMAHNVANVAFLDVMDAKVQAEIRSELPSGFAIQFGESGDRAEQMAMIADADFILTAVAVDAEMIRAAPKLKLLHKWGIGVDKFDLDAARAARIPVAITAGANAGAVSEHTVMLMLATYRCLSLADRKLRDGVWIRPQIRGQAYQLSGKTVGIAGLRQCRPHGRAPARRLRCDDPLPRHPPRRSCDREIVACDAGVAG